MRIRISWDEDPDQLGSESGSIGIRIRTFSWDEDPDQLG